MTRQFQAADFTLFSIPDLAHRMEAIRQQIQPKFAKLAEQVAPYLTHELDRPMYTHIAQHARRTKNPPEETWVAWSDQKRGYKAHPHFQVGICATHLFVWFALISEYPHKPSFATTLIEHPGNWPTLPVHFCLSGDHTDSDPDHCLPYNKESRTTLLQRLQTLKKAEFLCGTLYPRQEVIGQSLEQIGQRAQSDLQHLLPFYRLAQTQKG
jgi:uncharacterized protein YktB (UPF0637 family)